MTKNMNRLNELIKYIEENLDKEINVSKMSQILCVNNYTLQRIFKFITGITLSEYIRNRRLSVAGIELLSGYHKIIDIALKYGYSSPVGFSRAFSKFHGIHPKDVKKNTNYLKSYPPYSFSNIQLNQELNYRIEHHDKFLLNGVGFEADLIKIHNLAPKFWNKMLNDNRYKDILNDYTAYGITSYDEKFPNPEKAHYYVASEKALEDSTLINFSESYWAIFSLDKYTGDYIYNFAHYVYAYWIPYSGYSVRNLPEVEVYYDDYAEWWLPIEKNNKQAIN